MSPEFCIKFFDILYFNYEKSNIFSIGILFLIYARFEYQEITPDAVQSIQRLGTAFYILFAISIADISASIFTPPF